MIRLTANILNTTLNFLASKLVVALLYGSFLQADFGPVSLAVKVTGTSADITGGGVARGKTAVVSSDRITQESSAGGFK